MGREDKVIKNQKIIKEALISLLLSKEYLDISVAEISKSALITRMTFYRHFKNKEEVVVSILDDIFENIKKDLEKIENPTFKDLLIARFKALKNFELSRIIYSDPKINSLIHEFGMRNKNIFDKLLTEELDEYHLEFIRGGINKVTMIWIEKDMYESPEYMANQIISIISFK